MVSGALVQGAGRTDRSGFAWQNALRLRADTAIEFDFGSGWAEAIGQSAYYSLQTEKRAGIDLIFETVKDRKYWIRLNTTIEHFKLPIDTWIVEE